MSAPLDGRTAALNLLAELERINQDDDNDEASTAAVKAAIRAGVAMPEHEFEAFAEVFGQVLQNVVLGYSVPVDYYRSAQDEA